MTQKCLLPNEDVIEVLLADRGNFRPAIFSSGSEASSPAFWQQYFSNPEAGVVEATIRERTAHLESHIAGLRRFARALLRGNCEEADDLVQDTLERALLAWDRRRPGGDLRGWLYTILYNRFLSGEERRRRRGAHADLSQIREEALPTACGGQDGSLVHRDIVRAVAALPEQQRAVLLLIGLEELSYGEAARVLGVPIGTVMSRLSRARGRLRRHLYGEEWPRPPLRIAAVERPCKNISLQ